MAVDRANGDGHVASVLPMLVRYESDVLRLRQCLNVVRFDGRDHLLRDIQRNDERFRSPTVQHIVAGWIVRPRTDANVDGEVSRVLRGRLVLKRGGIAFGSNGRRFANC